MIYYFIHNDEFTEEMQAALTKAAINIVNDYRVVRLKDENLAPEIIKEYLKFTSANYLEAIKAITNGEAVDNKKPEQASFYKREPFASKQLKDGRNLFRRKHGRKETIEANSEKEIIFTVPYAAAKINKLEIIDANALDRVDMYVKSPADPATAAAYGMPPDYLLNQFGFNVVVCYHLYSDKSDYDADVYAGFQIVVKYKNDSSEAKTVGLNLIYHELV